MRIPVLFVFSFLSFSFYSTSQADIVTQSFTGVITAVKSGGQAGPSIGTVDGISIGNAFTAVFSYQSNNSGADSDGSANQGFFFITPSADTFMTINVNGRVFQKSSTGNLSVQTFNNVVSTLSNNTDLMSLGAVNSNLPTGWSSTANTFSTRLTFADATGLAIPSDALPTSFSPNWSTGLFSHLFNENVTTPTGVINQLYIEGNLTAVPEPSAIVLMSVALVVALCLFRKHRLPFRQTASCRL